MIDDGPEVDATLPLGVKSCSQDEPIGIESSMRPFCQNLDACNSPGPRHCKRCAAIMRGADPEYRRKMSEAKLRSFAADPSKRKRVSVSASKGLKLWHASIDWSAFHGDRVEAYFEWCPPERRAEYQKFRRLFGARKAKALILDDIAHKDRAEARAEVRRNAEAMLAKHRREVASRY